jgi:hypothetical protein
LLNIFRKSEQSTATNLHRRFSFLVTIQFPHFHLPPSACQQVLAIPSELHSFDQKRPNANHIWTVSASLDWPNFVDLERPSVGMTMAHLAKS